MKVKIKRQASRDTQPYWQTFNFESGKRLTVAAILEQINYADDPVDENQNPCKRIRWECSCMQKMCGGCAMVINKNPALACAVFIDTAHTDLLTLEPLSKFPVICDLVVDRSIIHEYEKEAMMYLGTRAEPSDKYFPQQYSAAKCLKCGLCLEVCPNYVNASPNFFGAFFANDAFLLHSSTADRKTPIKQQYRKHFESGCSKSLACKNICPMHMPTLSSISYLNRSKG